MPLIKIINPYKNIFVGIWSINEELHTLQSMASQGTLAECEQIGHPLKKREFLASRIILEQVCNQQRVRDTIIHKTIHGKPFFPENNWHFSISHTEKYAVCAVSAENTIGIDVEKIQDKFKIIAPKFLTEKEVNYCNSNIDKIALRWCIKEAAYKWNGEKGLSFKEEILISEDLKSARVKESETQIHFEKIDEEHHWAMVF